MFSHLKRQCKATDFPYELTLYYYCIMSVTIVANLEKEAEATFGQKPKSMCQKHESTNMIPLFNFAVMSHRVKVIRVRFE